MFSGYLIDCFPLFDATDDLQYYLRKVNQRSHIEDIRDMFIAPQQIFKSPQGVSQLRTINDSLGDEPFTYYRVRSDMTQASTVYNQEIVLNKLHSFNTYANVKNNKLFTYPYNYLYVTNSIGNANIFKYEDFDYPDNQLAFNLQMSLSIGVSGRVIPVSYRGILQNYDEGVALAKFPTCSWSADSFTNWLTREAVNIVPEIAKTGAEFVTGNVGAGVSSIAGMIGSFYKASLMPDITGGQATGDVNFSAIKNNIKFERMHAKPEFLAQIDDYFSRYGYKTLRVKTANITGRQNWNFVQIGSDEIIGASNNHNNIPVPTPAMEKINEIFKSGVTCWHNHANIGNFGLNNPIV